MPLRKKIRTGHIISFILLLVSYFFIFQATWWLEKEYDHVANTYKKENKIRELRYFVAEAEAGARGYFLSKDESFLHQYTQNINKIPSVFNAVNELADQNKEPDTALDSIKILIDQRLAILKANIELFQLTGQFSNPAIDSNRKKGQAFQEKIRVKTDDYIATQAKIMIERKNKLTGSFTTTQYVTFISMLISITAILYSLYSYNRESKARDESAVRNVQYQHELEKHIEELKRMDAEVRELKSMEKYMATGRIARTIAHEVRNPLTNITLAADQLKEIIKTTDSSILLDMISRNAERINHLVSELLNATKAMELSIQKADINKILEDTLAMAADRIDLNGVRVEKQYIKERCEVDVDVKIIKVAFLNIIVNAIEAMEKNKGVLILRTKKQNKKCMVEIEDNGSGMDEDSLQKIFDPYFTSKAKGNGLGLTNTQNIIISHHGKIDVSSKPGKGSLFVISLNVSV